MCTLVVLRRPGHDWPLLLAANRDEMADRASAAPGRHWHDRPHVAGGLDRQAGGSWLALNDDGLVAAVLNRRGTLGAEAGKRSRGELVLDALDHAEATAATQALRGLDPTAYRPFNLILADAEHAFWLRHAGDGRIQALPVPAGLSLIDSGELNDPLSARLQRIRFLAETATPPRPEQGEWQGWQGLLADRAAPPGQPRDAICITGAGAYGTRSGSLLALPPHAGIQPVWLHAEGVPGDVPFLPVAL